jgi:hypothetical protein
MPEVTENFDFEPTPTETFDTPEDVLESSEASSGESMPEVTENFDFELDPTEPSDTPPEVEPESPEVHPTYATTESEPEPAEAEVPPWTPDDEVGRGHKEDIPEKQGDLLKPSGDPRDSAAAEDQALFNEVQQLREEQETELRQDIENFNNPSDPPDDDIAQHASDVGKVMKNDDEPGISTHLHRHEDGLTISTKDQNTGTVQRYNFNTGEGWEMNSDTPMSDKDRDHRLTAEVPDYNPNPDAGSIEGFHSGVWGASENEGTEDKEV